MNKQIHPHALCAKKEQKAQVSGHSEINTFLPILAEVLQPFLGFTIFQ